jgi:23S rRNA (guanosine2251-2'-O)-methyltransferase
MSAIHRENLEPPEFDLLYGIHTVSEALNNPKRKFVQLLATKNAAARLAEEISKRGLTVEETNPKALDRLTGPDSVHQGVVLRAKSLNQPRLDQIPREGIVVMLDQVTDPHNVGAVMRSALAFGADAIITTRRHAPAETGVLAKAASGALDRLAVVEVQNLARALEELRGIGFTLIGLDSEAEAAIEDAMAGDRVALVLGAEGKGLRRLTRDTCDAVARLSMPGPLASLNVSNAAVLALYLARRHLDGR